MTTERGNQSLGHHYPNITGHGSTRIHAGDNHFHGGAGLTIEQQCCQVFKTTTYEEYKDRNPPRLDGTCQWVLTHPGFRQWRQSEHADLLWISADLGCGKSVLAKSLVDHDLCEDDGSALCYFFFKDNEEQDNLVSATCAILHQLFIQRPDLIQHALPAWRANGDKIQKETYEMWRILQKSASDPSAPPILCVLDGLDECREQDQRQLVSLLQDSLRQATLLKFLITSRPYDSIQRCFEPTISRWPHIRLRGEDENDQIQREINLVILQRVQELVAEFALSHESRERLLATLVQMQHRTYLWLYLAIDHIRESFQNSLDPDMVTIDSLPNSVEEAYERLLQRIHHKQRSNARQILLIIVGARRPLKIEEMAWALGAAQVDGAITNCLKQLNVQHLKNQIRRWCGLFVVIQHSTLFLIHQTAKEFLLSTGLDIAPHPNIWRGSFSRRRVELEMLKICTTYLCLAPESARGSEASRYTTKSVNESGHDIAPGLHFKLVDHGATFFQYCAESWPGHAGVDIEVGDGPVFSRVLALYDDQSSLFSAWFNRFWKARWPYRDTPKLLSQHAMAFNGHYKVLAHRHREHRFDVELLDSLGCTTLYWAVEEGHLEAAEWLVKEGADINARGRSMSALEEASWQGHAQIVQMLLDNGADGYDCALQAASFRGHTQIARLLLDRAIHVDVHKGILGNALAAASIKGNTQIVQMLLDEGADNYNGSSRMLHAQIVHVLGKEGPRS